MKVHRTLSAVTLLVATVGASFATESITNDDLLRGLANPARWLIYSGDYTGQRHSPLTQITPANASQLVAQWTFQTGVPGKLETTPIVVDGVLYATGPMNHAWAIDGKTGRQLWHYQRTLPAPVGDGFVRACCGPVNRGFAVHHDRLYMGTLDAHLVALDMKTGQVVWDVEVDDYTKGYASTAAPLVVKDKLIVGMAGGEYANRGFLDAYDLETGKRVWRFWTVPGLGEPGNETWPRGTDAWQRGGGPTWVTGTYDPELNLLYWGTGNPNPDYYGNDRAGDNLYTCALLALDPDTGKLRWHYQFTPHDEHDWDANHVPVLAELSIGGRPRKLVMVANRNGFFYVLDRTNGDLLLAKPYVQTTWAKEMGKDGRPIELPNQRPTAEGTFTCPDIQGGTNFMSPSFSPATRLFYVTAREVCQQWANEPPKAGYKSGDRTTGRSPKMAAEGPQYGALRAIDPLTGARRWELRHATATMAGVLSTAGGVVFTGNSEGHFLAVDARTGKELWRYQTGAAIFAPPTTYMIDGRQYVIMPSGTTFTAFALPASR